MESSIIESNNERILKRQKNEVSTVTAITSFIPESGNTTFHHHMENTKCRDPTTKYQTPDKKISNIRYQPRKYQRLDLRC